MGYRIRWYGQEYLAKLRAEMRRRLRRAAADVATKVQRNISTSARAADRHGAVGSRPGEYPKAVTGALRRAIFSDLVSDSKAIIGVDQDSPARKYARRLEEGGTITASGKLMAVPLSNEARRFRGNIRSFPKPLTRIRRPGKMLLLVEIPDKTKTGRDSRRAWIIHFVLTPFVRIGRRSYLERTLNEMEQHVKRIMEDRFI